jgi:hypothetical protein
VGPRIIRLGRARATRYALQREIQTVGNHWEIYRISADGRPGFVATLRALHPRTWWYEASPPPPQWLYADLGDGVFPDLPWFLDDLRPQGFLGRAFTNRYRHELGLGPDLHLWDAADVLRVLLLHGEDLPGDFVIGARALERAQRATLTTPPAIEVAARCDRYTMLAEAAIAGEPAGSSAGGEQPKFTTCLRDGDGYRHVIVKFSNFDSAIGRRWSDLLVSEHLAAETLRHHGIAACETEWLESGNRCYLEVRRFDRIGAHGRRGVVTLKSLQSAYYNATDNWLAAADHLETDRWLSPSDADTLRVLWWFGGLIGNTDMHAANLGLFLHDALPLGLVPTYDMLPMHYRPTATGELLTRELVPPLPTPRHLEAWRRAATIAVAFWQRVAQDPRISQYLQSEGSRMVEVVRSLMDHLG